VFVHSDLVLVSGLWQLDHQVDLVRQRAGALKAVVGDLDVQLGDNAKAIDETANALAENIKEEAGVQRDLDRYIIRRDRAAKLLEGGEDVDFDAVQKQLEQCQEYVDRLEGEVLDCMEQREALIDAGSALETQGESLKDEKGRAYEQWVVEGRQIRSEIDEVWPRRQALSAELTSDIRQRYEGFRQREEEPVATLGDVVCLGCNVVVHDQVRIEVNNGRRVHCCRGCGRWLLPTPSPEGDEG
jgi:predicted  nucleic acid-binding Zn-ribbon protein